MKPPLHIAHINLQSLDAPPPPPPCSRQAHYLQFWWQQKPLGQLLIRSGQTWTNEGFVKAIAEAIQPAMEVLGVAPRDYTRLAAEMEKWKWWQGKMEALIPVYDPEKLPRKVPVSLIICTRNRPEALEACLQSIFKMQCQPEEIIIVDNAPSDDGTRKLVERHPAVQYALEPAPGLSQARNTGVQLAKCPYIAFTDDDVEVHPLWIYQVWKALEEHGASALTGLVLASELKTESQVIFELRWPFNRGYVPIIFDRNFLEQNKDIGAPVWDIGAGANMAFRKEVFVQTGLFDIRLGAGACGCNEDSELWFRILRQNGTILYTPDAVVYHQHRSKMAELKRQVFLYMRGFVVTALLQHHQWPEGGYRTRIYRMLPLYYARLVKRGLPFFRFKYRTLGTEIRGILAGFSYYRKHFIESPEVQTAFPDISKALATRTDSLN